MNAPFTVAGLLIEAFCIFEVLKLNVAPAVVTREFVIVLA